MPALRHRWTTAAVRELIDESRPWPRYELLGGELIVTPAPGNPHQLAVGEFFFVLKAYTDRHDLGATLMSPADLELVPGTIAQPDVFVAPLGEDENWDVLPGWSHVKSLLVAIEVVSPSSVRTDRVEKRDHYLGAGVPEYWVVDVEGRVVERWSAERETPQILRHTLVWQPAHGVEPLTVDLVPLFEGIWKKVRRLRLP